MLHNYRSDSLLYKILNMLSHPSIAPAYWIFIGGQLGCILLSFFIRQQRILCILIYFFTVTLYNKAYIAQNSGDTLTVLMLFYLMFMNEYMNENHWTTNQKLRTADITLTNFAFLAAGIQVALVYFVAGVTKLKGEHWPDGTALYYVFSIDEYSCMLAKNYIATSGFLVHAGTYLALAVQLGFPVFVWFRKTRKFTLAAGCILHLLIALLVGLTDFGFVMPVMYLLFFTEEESKKILGRVTALLPHRLPSRI
jgi:hypothetical protein